MNSTQHATRLAACLGLALVFRIAACGGDSVSPKDAAVPDSAPRDTPGAEELSDGNLANDGGPQASDGGPVRSCEEVAGTDCFSNYDCPETMRCENVGPSAQPVPCCVVGSRGTGRVGEPCTSENDCASGVCVEQEGSGLCSDVCTGPEDCPAAMGRCIFVALSGSNDKWCFPE